MIHQLWQQWIQLTTKITKSLLFGITFKTYIYKEVTLKRLWKKIPPYFNQNYFYNFYNNLISNDKFLRYLTFNKTYFASVQYYKFRSVMNIYSIKHRWSFFYISLLIFSSPFFSLMKPKTLTDGRRLLDF